MGGEVAADAARDEKIASLELALRAARANATDARMGELANGDDSSAKDARIAELEDAFASLLATNKRLESLQGTPPTPGLDTKALELEVSKLHASLSTAERELEETAQALKDAESREAETQKEADNAQEAQEKSEEALTTSESAATRLEALERLLEAFDAQDARRVDAESYLARLAYVQTGVMPPKWLE